jgi:hypothetical protein
MTKKKASGRARDAMEGQIRQVVGGGTARARESARPAAAPGLPSVAEYERDELTRARRRLEEVERAPLADRKEAQAVFLSAMRDHPELVAERIDWILDGTHGNGEMQMARRILASPRMNRAAALAHLAAALEWSTPGAMARAAWHQLSARQQAALDRAIQDVIRQAEANIAEG